MSAAGEKGPKRRVRHDIGEWLTLPNGDRVMVIKVLPGGKVLLGIESAETVATK